METSGANGFQRFLFHTEGRENVWNERCASATRAKRSLCSSATRVAYMQFVLTKRASLSHCAPRERDARRDRRRDLNSLF